MDANAARANESSYALSLANSSYEWYFYAAKKARRYHRLSEIVNLLASSAIPVSVVAFPGIPLIPAMLGSLVVIVTGLRSAFHWHDDYIRFSEVRESVEAERRLYLTHSDPYADPDSRDKILAASITRIEQKEMSNWIKIARPRNPSKGTT
ncbi:DUF4231 domain-containing protein [Actinomadura madurae]|uniref:DUF4231 domain-containing protein n=1 Tax=Actinomadura madurae TaxID=1993 RepID=UPI000DCF7D3E|nr:DUF4231 domain-containing protein [Actinomadura madurae]